MKKISILLCVFIVFSMLFIPRIKVNAASYPLIIPDEYVINAKTGDKLAIKFSIFPKYKNEEIVYELYNPNNELIWNDSKSYTHVSDEMLTYTLNWDTTSMSPDKYTLEITYKFYTYFQWREAPTKKHVWITLECGNHVWDWKNATIVKKATYTKAGIEKCYCKYCTATKERKTAKEKLTAPYVYMNQYVSDTATKICWRQVSGVKGYEVQFSTNKNYKNAKKYKFTSCSKTKKTFYNLIDHKKYYYKIRSYYKGVDDNGKVKIVYSKWEKHSFIHNQHPGE